MVKHILMTAAKHKGGKMYTHTHIEVWGRIFHSNFKNAVGKTPQNLWKHCMVKSSPICNKINICKHFLGKTRKEMHLFSLPVCSDLKYLGICLTALSLAFGSYSYLNPLCRSVFCKEWFSSFQITLENVPCSTSPFDFCRVPHLLELTVISRKQQRDWAQCS